MEGKDETELPTYDRAIPAPSEVDSTPSGEGMEVDQDSSDSNSNKATGQWSRLHYKNTSMEHTGVGCSKLC